MLSEDADLANVGGIDISITDRAVVAQPTNVDDIVNVEITATAQASVNGEDVPLGSWIRDALDDDDLEELEALDETSDEADATFPITAVREDGRWYLSAFYSLAESLRHEAGDPDIPAAGVALNGGKSPEAAMDNLLEAAASLDLDALIGSLNPDEFDALQRYAPLITDDAQGELDAADVALTVSDTAYEVSGSGGTRHLTVRGFEVEIEAEGERATMELADGCVTVTADFDGEAQTMNTCDDLADFTEMTDARIDPEQLEDLQDLAGDILDDYENPGFTVKEVDGSWYVSPIATGFDQLFALSGALSRDDIEELVDRAGELVETVEDSGGFDVVPLPGLPDYTRPGAADATPSTVPDDTMTATTEVAGVMDECFAASTAAAAADCFAGARRQRGHHADDVPWWLQHPECGVTEIYWDGEYSSLPDAEFVALVDRSRAVLPGVRRRRGDVRVRAAAGARQPRVPRREEPLAGHRGGARRLLRLRVRLSGPAGAPGRRLQPS